MLYLNRRRHHPEGIPGSNQGWTLAKSLAFLYTNNEKIEREIKETIPFTIAMKRLKYLELYLPKETNDLYTENYKTQVKKSKRTLIDGEIYRVHGSEKSI